ncbi:MAG: hypothetical protein K6T66_10955 [Peptococcaceae bacterium]|nr:hypothetical protein [Peptococcaceae bacterium]
MVLPCVCFKCARYLSLESLKDPECLSVEEKNCEDRDCNNCDFTCERFTENMDFKRTGKIPGFLKW